MSETENPCARFSHVDPLAYLLDREASDFTEWRNHFPGCAECSAALSALSALEWQLGELGDAHPEAPELNAFALGHGLGDAERAQIDAHISSCPMCSDQLRALARFEDATSQAGVGAQASERAGASLFAGLIETIRNVLQPVPGPVWVGAIALLLFAAYGVMNGFGPGQSDQSNDPPQIAQQGDSPAPPLVAPIAPVVPMPDQSAPPHAPTLPLAGHDPSLKEPTSSAPTADSIEQRPTTERIDPGALAETATRSPEIEVEVEVVAEEPAEMLLASLDLPAVLRYRGTGHGRGRLDMLGRGAQSVGDGGAPIQVLAPKADQGLSATTAGVLIWSIFQERPERVRLTIVDDRQIDPVIDVPIEGPQAAGLHGFDLAAHGVELEPGVDYIWSVSLEVDAARPSRSPRSQAVLSLLEDDAAAANRLAEAKPGDRIEAELTNGLWYDLLSDLSRAAASGNADAAAFRSALRDLAVGEGIAVGPVVPPAAVTMHLP